MSATFITTPDGTAGADIHSGLAHYFRFYNHERPHQALGYRAPAQVYGVVTCTDDAHCFINVFGASRCLDIGGYLKRHDVASQSLNLDGV
ncbi:MAG: transposase [Ktedonobacterales bacterium]|nr:transposase [Ktedonobacterales bacterium]